MLRSKVLRFGKHMIPAEWKTSEHPARVRVSLIAGHFMECRVFTRADTYSAGHNTMVEAIPICMADQFQSLKKKSLVPIRAVIEDEPEWPTAPTPDAGPSSPNEPEAPSAGATFWWDYTE